MGESAWSESMNQRQWGRGQNSTKEGVCFAFTPILALNRLTYKMAIIIELEVISGHNNMDFLFLRLI